MDKDKLLKRAKSLNQKEKYQQVIDLLTDAVLDDLKSSDLLAEKGRAHYWLENYELSVQEFDKAINLNPKDPFLHYLISQPYNDLQELTNALNSVTKAIELDSNKAIYHFQLGVILSNLNESEKAIISINKAIELNPEADYYLFLSFAYKDINEPEKAIKTLKKSIEIDPNDSSYHYFLSNLYEKVKESEKAIKALQKAIELEPHVDYYFALGDIYFRQKDYVSALNAFKKAVELDPKDAVLYFSLGGTYHQLKENEEALKVLQKAIELDPTYDEAYFAIGYIYTELDENDKAIDFYKKAIEVNPEHLGSHLNLGSTYFIIKSYNLSREHYEKFLELSKDNPDYYTTFAKSRIAELKKLIGDELYSKINEQVNKIKSLLHYKDDCITHYTSLSVAKLLIIENSNFRLSEGAFLNDTSEGRVLLKFLPIDNSSLQSDETVARPFAQKPFIGSFVTDIKHDDLTLWRMYGKEEKEEAKGCAITLDREKLLEALKEKLTQDTKLGKSLKIDQEFNFYKVAYRKEGTEDQFIIPGAEDDGKILNEYMQELASNIKLYLRKNRKAINKQKVVRLINEITYLFKSAEYQHEHELRLVVEGIGFPKEITRDNNQIKEDLKPPRVYIELVSIRSMIQKITLGPKVERADEWAAAFYYSLDKQNHNPDIFISHLPFK